MRLKHLDAHAVGTRIWVGAFPRTDEEMLEAAQFRLVLLMANDWDPASNPETRSLRRLVQKNGDRFVYHGINDDDVLTVREQKLVVEGAWELVAFQHVGPVLVLCNMGMNRSALVAAGALIIENTYTPDRAIDQVRNRRHPKGGRALSNPTFKAFLRGPFPALAWSRDEKGVHWPKMADFGPGDF